MMCPVSRHVSPCVAGRWLCLWHEKAPREWYRARRGARHQHSETSYLRALCRLTQEMT